MTNTKRITRSIAVVLSLAALGLAPQRVEGERGPAIMPPAATADADYEARVIVKYRSDAAMLRERAVRSGNHRPLYAAAIAQRLRMPLTDGRVLGPRTQSLRGTGLTSAQLAQRLSAMADVEWAVPDKRRYAVAAPNDPLFADAQTTVTPAVGQWYLRAPDATTVSAINALAAWDITTGSSAITVALLDSGVLTDHPDLAGKLHPGYDFVQNATTGNDGSGRDGDPTDPGDHTSFGECGVGQPAQASSWHGTQVAGLVGAATDNGIGMAGTGRNVMLLPVRVLGRCGGFDSDIIAAMRWSAGLTSEVGFGASQTLVNAHPARVLNMSLGSSDSCAASYRDVLAELNAAGVSVVIAAGNRNGLAVNTPANCPGAIAVAGVRHTGTKVGYSNVGPEVAIAAPAGNCVNLVGTCLYPLITTTNTGTTAAAANVFSDGDAPSVGTSFATPLVAGTVALMLSANPGLPPQRVHAILQATARAFPGSGAAPAVTACHAADGTEQLECYCTTGTCGAGLLDAAQAVAMALEPVAAIGAGAFVLTSGASVMLDAGPSTAGLGRSLAGFAWSITAGAPNARLSGATNGSTVTLLGTAPGAVTVQLVVTDNLGASATTSTTFSVVSAAVAAAETGSGGGAWRWDGALVLAAAVVAWRLRRRATIPRDAATSTPSTQRP